MFELFMMGGPLFMGIITIIFIAALVVSVRLALLIFGGASVTSDQLFRQLGYIKSIGLFALVMGVLGQMVGLYSAFAAMEQMEGGVAPQLLAGGLKVSSITTLWGLLSYGITLLIYLILSAVAKSKQA
ncbi:MAG: MotA/TolQ/ExbB proton channel family protein [Marinoscillum sp.]|uniref:MotA/TolQ/ExbB proton channel family protein n=1 Tax=Marinoscillum sp. TaxID=2024838 RepID=UPI0032F98A35